MNMGQAEKVVQKKAETRIQKEQFYAGVKWECKSCGYFLGYVSEDKTTIRMKARDFFVTVEGGKIYHPCRNCGEFNEIVDDGYLLWQSEKKMLDEFLANRPLFLEFLRQRDKFTKFLSSEMKKRYVGKKASKKEE